MREINIKGLFAFTLTDGATQVNTSKFASRLAFTLVEVLITLGIIGVIAAVTIPTLMSNINQNVFNSQQDMALKRIKAATDQMRTNDLITAYDTNDHFADQFQKYIKISKRCDSSNLQGCFASTFKTLSGQSINLSDLTKGTDIGNLNGTNLVGLDLINGTTMLVAFSSSCQDVPPYNDTIDTTTCLSIVYDVNGLNKPNQIGKDIGMLNAVITSCDGAKIGGLCIAAGDTTYTPLGTYTDTYYDGEDYITDTFDNYWAGADKACKDKGMRIPTLSELNTMYQNKASLSGFNLTAWSEGSVYWSSDSDATSAWTVYFDGRGQYPQNKYNNASLRCVK